MAVDGNDEEPLAAKPQLAVRDHARLAGSAAIAAVPFVGGPASILLDGVLRPSYEKRLDAWLTELGDVVRALESRVDEHEDWLVGDSELFVSAVVRATQIALGTSIEQKILLLKRGLESVGAGATADEFLALRFLSFIDELAPEHFNLLAYACSPSNFLESTPSSETAATPRSIIKTSSIELDHRIIDLLIDDLSGRHLVAANAIDAVVLGGDLTRSFATPLGRELVRFVGLIWLAAPTYGAVVDVSEMYQSSARRAMSARPGGVSSFGRRPS